MRKNGSEAGRLRRAYGIASASLALLLVPAALIRIGTVRKHQVSIGYVSAADGCAPAIYRGSAIHVRFVSVDGGTPVRAGSLSFLREVQSLPAGTRLRFDVESGRGAPQIIDGRVENLAASPADQFQRVLSLALIVTFALFGLGLAMSAADRRAQTAAAALSGVALLFASMILEPTTSAIRDAVWRDAALIVWQSFPRAIALYYLAAFAATFPQSVAGNSRALRMLLRVTFGAGCLLTLIESCDQIGLISDRLPLAAQRAFLLTSYRLQSALYALSLFTVLVAWRAQARSRSALQRQEGNRLVIVWRAVLVGMGVPAALGVLQMATFALRGRLFLPSPVMMASFATMLVIPPAVAYASRARRVDPLGVLVARAALFAFSRRAFYVFSWLPIVTLLVLIYRDRNKPIMQIASAHPIATPLLAVIALLSLRYAGDVSARIELLFFHDRADGRRTLAALAKAIPQTAGLDEVCDLLEREIDRALHLETVKVFLSDKSNRFRARGAPWFLEFFSAVVAALPEAGAPVIVDVDRSAVLARATEFERLWLTETRTQWLVPLRARQGALIAFIGLGEKRSGLPFDAEDLLLLESVTASAALAIENELLRVSGSSAASPDVADEVRPPAVYCASCSRISDDSLAFCADDGGALIPADVPALIADKYLLESYVGAGAMGVVYRARDLSLGRTVAIKTLPRVSADAAARFRREARAGAAMTHPALALIFSAETWNGRPLIVMEYVPYGTLAKRLRDRPLAIREVVHTGLVLADALAALHDHGVLHRDVKPSNVGFSAGDQPKLLDFGLARLLSETADAVPQPSSKDVSPRGTASSGIIGTPAYLPPEAIVGARDDVAVDLWGLSMSMYEAFTGIHPFRHEDAFKVMNRIVSEDVPDVRTMRPDCPPDVAVFLARALSRDRTRRPQTARSFASELGTLATA